MNFHPLTCRACGDFAEIPGGCSCPDAEPEMAEIEHQPAREGMTGVNFTTGLRPEFRTCDALDAPWLLPLGGVVVHLADNVADCFVEREQDDDARLLERAAEIEAGELCREAA